MYILFLLIGILCFYGILIMECIYYSLWLVFYISMGSWSCNVYTIPSDWYFMFLWYPDHGMYILFPLIGILCFYGILIMECIYYSLWLVFYISMGSWSWNVYTLPSDWYFMFLWDPDHVLYILFPPIGILCFYEILIM
jgi:hypothetical protein